VDKSVPIQAGEFSRSPRVSEGRAVPRPDFHRGLWDSSFEAKHTRLHELIGKMDEIFSAAGGRGGGMWNPNGFLARGAAQKRDCSWKTEANPIGFRSAMRADARRRPGALSSQRLRRLKKSTGTWISWQESDPDGERRGSSWKRGSHG